MCSFLATQRLIFQTGNCLLCTGRDNSTLWGSIRGFVEEVFIHISGFQPLLENDSVHEDVSQEPIVRNSVEIGLDVAF